MISELIGKTIIKIEGGKIGSEKMVLTCSDNTRYISYYDECLLEDVVIEDVCGDLNNLIGIPIIMAEDITNEFKQGEYLTWTFCKFATIKGYVTIRWTGEGTDFYYSEYVDFKREN